MTWIPLLSKKSCWHTFLEIYTFVHRISKLDILSNHTEHP